MTRAMVTIAEKAEPAMGKKRGRIKDSAGLVYQMPPALLPMVNVGLSYDIDYKDDEYNGAKFRVVESVSPAIPQGSKQTAPSPQQRMAPMDDERQVDISVLSLMTSTKWGEKIPAGDMGALEHCLRSLRAAWINHKKSRIQTGRQEPSSDFNDEIPL